MRLNTIEARIYATGEPALLKASLFFQENNYIFFRKIIIKRLVFLTKNDALFNFKKLW